MSTERMAIRRDSVSWVATDESLVVLDHAPRGVHGTRQRQHESTVAEERGERLAAVRGNDQFDPH